MINSNDDLKHNDLCVGIDLGTTNSVLATINVKPNGDIVSKVVEIPRAVDMYNSVSSEVKFTKQKKPTLPSCVYYREENNYEPLVGDFAKFQYQLRPHLVAKSIKSQMGKPFAEGLSLDVPDKTPAEISSRILKHMLKATSNIYRTEITDAVITVPANFDSSMCKATIDAAKLAGIKTKNSDGSERPILLSEPNAVIYDLINQINNGEISSHILDLSEEKNVLVFDLGGGTLDITMHKIKRRDNLKEVLEVNEIATNRYTLLGGDDFDEEIAKAMYERYKKQYSNKGKEIILKIEREKDMIMPKLRAYAEFLKLEISEKCSEDYCSDSGWDDYEDEISAPTGGNMPGGLSYDDTFTKEEVESILSTFMADNLVFEDYKRIDSISSTRNIIYPILDVLDKASKKMNVENVVIDAVIVNGGMSKFYMVTERLEKFFGFKPIEALDPDQAVARGAAVYHYYLHKYDEIKDNMRIIGEEEGNEKVNDERVKTRPLNSYMPIEWGKSILNDSLYLGVKNGGVHKIIPTGAELPYKSEVMTGFQINPGQNMIAIPIKSRNLDGTYRIIANGNIIFKNKYPDGAYVAFEIYMNNNKVITMKAWTSNDTNGLEKIEEGYVEINIDNNESSNIKTKIIAPSGSKLQPKDEINNMLQLCKNYERCRNKPTGINIAKKIKSSVKNICNAQNKEDFAEVILKALDESSSQEEKQRLFVIARKIGYTWKDAEKRKLVNCCMLQLRSELLGITDNGPKISTNNQAIYTLSVCANENDMEKLSALHNNSKYYQSCLYSHAKTKTDVYWLKQQLENDIKKVMKRRQSNLQFTSYAMGIALRKDESNVLNLSWEENIVKQLKDAIKSKNLTHEELVNCVISLGLICDNRQNNYEPHKFDDVIDTIEGVDSTKCMKAKEVAIKMIKGEILNSEEEAFLLTKLEIE